jgi:hypothetical protein
VPPSVIVDMVEFFSDDSKTNAFLGAMGWTRGTKEPQPSTEDTIERETGWERGRATSIRWHLSHRARKRDAGRITDHQLGTGNVLKRVDHCRLMPLVAILIRSIHCFLTAAREAHLSVKYTGAGPL